MTLFKNISIRKTARIRVRNQDWYDREDLNIILTFGESVRSKKLNIILNGNK